MDLFDFSKPLLREKIRGSQTGGYTAPSKESVYTDDLVVSRKKGKDYVKEYLEKEKSIPVEVSIFRLLTNRPIYRVQINCHNQCIIFKFMQSFARTV